jgi:ankyrin repeat protein
LTCLHPFGTVSRRALLWRPLSAARDQPIFDFLLAQVVVQGKPDLVRYLLEHGANPNAVSRYNHRSCLTIARLTGRTEIAGPLEQFGDTPKGSNGLHLVSQLKQDDPDLDASIAIIDLLLKYGADPLARNHADKTPEQWIRSLGMDEVADYMAERFTRHSG